MAAIANTDAISPMKGTVIRFMSWMEQRREFSPGGGPGKELQELFYEWEKHVGRFPEWHVPGVGYHSVRRIGNERGNLERGLDRQGIESSMNDERWHANGTHFTAPIVMLGTQTRQHCRARLIDDPRQRESSRHLGVGEPSGVDRLSLVGVHLGIG